MFAKIRGDFDFLELFEGIVVSGEEQVAKPDPKVFALLLDRFALTAAETVFIDDSAPNVAAAAELGMVGLHFRDAPGLRADLTRLRLLSDDGGSG
jgi:2-haloacid dehalogenase